MNHWITHQSDLVGGWTNPSENYYSQNWIISSSRGENNKCIKVIKVFESTNQITHDSHSIPSNPYRFIPDYSSDVFRSSDPSLNLQIEKKGIIRSDVVWILFLFDVVALTKYLSLNYMVPWFSRLQI